MPKEYTWLTDEKEAACSMKDSWWLNRYGENEISRVFTDWAWGVAKKIYLLYSERRHITWRKRIIMAIDEENISEGDMTTCKCSN